VTPNGVTRVLTSPSRTLSQSEVAGRTPTAEVGGLCLQLPADWVAALADVVAARLAHAAVDASPWLDRKAAATHLGVSASRLEKDRTVPSHRWEGRVLYHRLELDEWLLGMGPK
jgi:hypothetical protein